MKRGRKPFRHLNSKQLRRQVKRLKKSLGIGKHKKFETLICNRCKQKFKIHLNKNTVIDDDVRQKYICIFCKGRLGIK